MGYDNIISRSDAAPRMKENVIKPKASSAGKGLGGPAKMAPKHPTPPPTKHK